MLPYLRERAIVLNRFPDGVDQPGFYAKDAPVATPGWVRTFRRYSETADRNIDYIVVDDLDTLIWLANLAAIEINMPLSRVNSYESPDMVFFDIDPEPPASFSDGVHAAFLLKELLGSISLRPYVKTSGKKGLHVVVPITAGYTFAQTREFVHRVGREAREEGSENCCRVPKVAGTGHGLHRLSPEYRREDNDRALQPPCDRERDCFPTAHLGGAGECPGTGRFQYIHGDGEERRPLEGHL